MAPPCFLALTAYRTESKGRNSKGGAEVGLTNHAGSLPLLFRSKSLRPPIFQAERIRPQLCMEGACKSLRTLLKTITSSVNDTGTNWKAVLGIGTLSTCPGKFLGIYCNKPEIQKAVRTPSLEKYYKGFLMTTVPV